MWGQSQDPATSQRFSAGPKNAVGAGMGLQKLSRSVWGFHGRPQTCPCWVLVQGSRLQSITSRGEQNRLGGMQCGSRARSLCLAKMTLIKPLAVCKSYSYRADN